MLKMKCKKCNKSVESSTSRSNVKDRCTCVKDGDPTIDKSESNVLCELNEGKLKDSSSNLSSKRRKLQSVLLSTINPDLWVGLQVRVQKIGNQKDDSVGDSATVIRSGNGWVQLKTSTGMIAKRAYHLELVDPSQVSQMATISSTSNITSLDGSNPSTDSLDNQVITNDIIEEKQSTNDTIVDDDIAVTNNLTEKSNVNSTVDKLNKELSYPESKYSDTQSAASHESTDNQLKSVPPSPHGSVSASITNTKRTSRTKRKFDFDENSMTSPTLSQGSSSQKEMILPTRTRHAGQHVSIVQAINQQQRVQQALERSPVSTKTTAEKSHPHTVSTSITNSNMTAVVPNRTSRQFSSAQEEYYSRGSTRVRVTQTSTRASSSATNTNTTNILANAAAMTSNVATTNTTTTTTTVAAAATLNKTSTRRTPLPTPELHAVNNTPILPPMPSLPGGYNLNHTGPRINFLLAEMKRNIVTKYVERHSEKIKDRPDLGEWIIKINSTIIDPIYEKSIARKVIFDDRCVSCQYEFWSDTNTCWNQYCVQSPIYANHDINKSVTMNTVDTPDKAIHTSELDTTTSTSATNIPDISILSNTSTAVCTTPTVSPTKANNTTMGIRRNKLSLDTDTKPQQSTTTTTTTNGGSTTSTSTDIRLEIPLISVNSMSPQKEDMMTSPRKRSRSFRSNSIKSPHSSSNSNNILTLNSPGRKRAYTAENNYGYNPTINSDTLSYYNTDLLPSYLLPPKIDMITRYLWRTPTCIYTPQQTKNKGLVDIDTDPDYQLSKVDTSDESISYDENTYHYNNGEDSHGNTGKHVKQYDSTLEGHSELDQRNSDGRGNNSPKVSNGHDRLSEDIRKRNMSLSSYESNDTYHTTAAFEIQINNSSNLVHKDSRDDTYYVMNTNNPEDGMYGNNECVLTACPR